MADAPKTVPFSEAQKCPQCDHMGKVILQRPIVGGTLHTIQCGNAVCPWYNTNWMVETDVNGEAQVNEQAWKAAHGERLIALKDPAFDAAYESVHQMLERQIQQETQGRRP